MKNHARRTVIVALQTVVSEDWEFGLKEIFHKMSHYTGLKSCSFLLFHSAFSEHTTTSVILISFILNPT